MSGQWEIVGKKKEKGNQKIGPQTNKKKVENINVKVEDVLAKSQVRNLYSSGKNKENKPVEIKKVYDLGTTKMQKKQDKPLEVSKPKGPKSVESALKQIDINEFENIFVNSKSHFPEAPIVWLKDLAHFLNQRLNVESQDPVYSQKVQNFPLTAVPVDIKSLIEKALQEANKSNIQLFFDISLTSMATDMSKNLPALGHKLFLQYIALNEPGLVTANLAKHCVLRSSYQNRPYIGLSILWAVGHAGVNNFEAGLAIFQELMLPLIELKNYSRYIIQYLLALISYNKEALLTREQFLFILEIIFSNKKNFPVDLKQNLISVIPNLKSSLFSAISKETFKNSFEFYLKKIPTNESDSYQACLCDVIIEGFSKDPSSLEHWTKIYMKNITPSTILLRYVDNNWQTVSDKLSKKLFMEAIEEIIATKDLVKEEDGGLLEIIRTAKRLSKRMTDKKSRSSFKLLFMVTCMVVATFMYCDIKQEGSWLNSNTNIFLKKTGVYEYSDRIFQWAKQNWFWLDEQVQEKCPSCHKAIVNFAQPYVLLIGNLARIFCNFCVNIIEAIEEKYPVILQSIDLYAPGLVKQSQNAVNNAWTTSVFYFNKSIDYLWQEVFVGQLSPKNMQKVVFEALNTTQHRATEYYHWLYKKVQSTIKQSL